MTQEAHVANHFGAILAGLVLLVFSPEIIVQKLKLQERKWGIAWVPCFPSREGALS